MGLASLSGFIGAMWLLVLVVAAFLVSFIAPLEKFVKQGATRLEISLIQAVIAIGGVVGLVLALSWMKRVYLGFAFRHQT